MGLLLLGAALALPLAGANALDGPGKGLYPDRPPPAHTGGFGEPTCMACHFDSGLNEGAGGVTVRERPEPPNPRTGPLELEVVLEDPELVRGGFQLAVRWAGGPDAGASAGVVEPADDRTETVRAGERDITYLHQTEAGTEPSGDGTARWTFRWTPPDPWAHPVVVHVAANAANGDASEFGDRIYADSTVLSP